LKSKVEAYLLPKNVSVSSQMTAMRRHFANCPLYVFSLLLSMGDHAAIIHRPCFWCSHRAEWRRGEEAEKPW